jgi:polyisoprenoid-binding protein YceI
MGISDGTYRVGPDTGRLLVKTTRTGLGARAGHDLTIEVTRWQADVTVDAADPGNCSVRVTAEVDSFEVRTGSGGVKPLTDADRADIRKTVREKILNASRYPAITFASTLVAGTPGSFSIEGDLTIAGVTKPVTVRGSVVDGQAKGAATIAQTRWGIKPYTAFLGALKLSDEVSIEFDAPIAARTS